MAVASLKGHYFPLHLKSGWNKVDEESNKGQQNCGIFINQTSSLFIKCASSYQEEKYNFIKIINAKKKLFPTIYDYYKYENNHYIVMEKLDGDIADYFFEFIPKQILNNMKLKKEEKDNIYELFKSIIFSQHYIQSEISIWQRHNIMSSYINKVTEKDFLMRFLVYTNNTLSLNNEFEKYKNLYYEEMKKQEQEGIHFKYGIYYDEKIRLHPGLGSFPQNIENIVKYINFLNNYDLKGVQIEKYKFFVEKLKLKLQIEIPKIQEKIKNLMNNLHNLGYDYKDYKYDNIGYKIDDWKDLDDVELAKLKKQRKTLKVNDEDEYNMRLYFIDPESGLDEINPKWPPEDINFEWWSVMGQNKLINIINYLNLIGNKKFISQFLNNKEYLDILTIKVSYKNNSFILGGKRKTKTERKIRKHKGIIQSGGNKGKLKKGYKYVGIKLKNGLPKIIKCKKK